MSFTGAKLTAHADKFTYPGIYQYTVSESVHNATENKEYEDVSNDTSNRYVVKVYVGYNDANLAVTHMEVSTDGSEGTKTDNLSFVSNYDPAKVTVTKKFAGNQAISSDTFTFKINISGKTGEEYSAILRNASGEAVGQTQKVTAANDTAEITISNVGKDYTFEIVGLSDTDTYTITETVDKGYTSSLATTPINNATTETDTNYTVTNTKNGAVPTGILMSAAPYVGLVGLGGIFAGLFFRRKRED